MGVSTWRPASKKYTVNSAELSKQLTTSGGIVLRGVIVTGGGSSAAVRIIDSANGAGEAGPGPLNFLVAANAGESTADSIQVEMEKGLYIELEQGGSSNGEATVFYD